MKELGDFPVSPIRLHSPLGLDHGVSLQPVLRIEILVGWLLTSVHVVGITGNGSLYDPHPLPSI